MKKVLQKIVAGYRQVDRAYKRGYNTLLISCKEMTELSSRAADGDLPFGTRLRRRIHLSICSWCRRYERQIGFLHNHLSHYSEKSPEENSPTLPEEARSRIREKIRPH